MVEVEWFPEESIEIRSAVVWAHARDKKESYRLAHGVHDHYQSAACFFTGVKQVPRTGFHIL